jgi:predicted nucleic acid-binding protein
LTRAQVVWADRPLVEVYVSLRDRCDRTGHALAQRHHDADRWVVAAAVRLGIPLVTHDGIFRNVPGVVVESALAS